MKARGPKRPQHHRKVLLRTMIAVLVTGLACRSEAPSPAGLSEKTGAEADASARQPLYDVVESLRADLEATRHPADGGGHAWLAEGEAARAGQAGRWVVAYRAGPAGISVGGAVYFQVSPFWGWSTPQSLEPGRPGFTVVSTEAHGVELSPRALDQQLMLIEIGGRPLGPGEELRIDYGAGPAGAMADHYAESESRFWIAVDGDGDGVRQILADSPSVKVEAAVPARLVLTLPSTARPGEPVRITVALLDALGNAFAEDAGLIPLGRVSFSGRHDGEPLAAVDLPPAFELSSSDAGRRTFLWMPPERGVTRLIASGPRGLEAESNPVQVSERGARVLWADLQNHSGLSDGTGTPEDLLVYARDVAALDVVAITDHDHWGLLFLDQDLPSWQRLSEATRRFHAPGRFVTLMGYEWTNWIHGHRHVLFFDDVNGDDWPLLSSIDPATDHPEELWLGLAEAGRVMTVAHHSAGGPISTDWSIAPDPRLEMLTEIVSVHGSSESADSPRPIYRPVAGNFVRDALARSHEDPRYRLGFLGSSDGHDGHPGLAHLASPSGGVTAILAEEATREGVWEALRSRHTYATNGPRILLRATLGGYRMGDDVPLEVDPQDPNRHVFAHTGPLPGLPAGTLVVQTITLGEIERIDVVRSGEVESGICETALSCSFGLPIADPRPGEYLYVRVVQKDGGAAWSSPFFFVAG